ncbi:MAG: hypothetical protein ATN35_03275 [Epulopiscium sp. Nele67-Bin004]|nr:MAG: hypothetical protein ATN35_03275 [Epulopiscium sp. Nele67-Bin004]
MLSKQTNFKCKQCSFEREYRTSGVEFDQFIDKQKVTDPKHAELVSKVDDVLCAGTLLYACECCYEIGEYYYYRFTVNNIECEPTHHCKKCDGTLVPLINLKDKRNYDVSNNINDNEHRKIALSGEDNWHLSDGGFGAYKCECCGNLKGKYFYVLSDGENFLKPTYKCGFCGGSMNYLPEWKSTDQWRQFEMPVQSNGKSKLYYVLDKDNNIMNLKCPSCTEGLLNVGINE